MPGLNPTRNLASENRAGDTKKARLLTGLEVQSVLVFVRFIPVVDDLQLIINRGNLSDGIDGTKNRLVLIFAVDMSGYRDLAFLG